MRRNNLISLILSFVFIFCGGSSETITRIEESPNEETVVNNDQISKNDAESSISNNTEKEKITEKANIEEVIKEFPQGALSFLSDKEQQCIAEISTTESLKSMEKSLIEEGAILQEQMDYFTLCNLPGPPGIGIKEENTSLVADSLQDDSYTTYFASIENIRSLGTDGVSPHLEKVDDKTLRLFYSSIQAKGIAVALCDYEFNCEIQGVLERMSDLTIVETLEGIRRGYFVELNPQTNQKDIFTAIFSEDGLSYSEKTPLGFPVDRDEIAWGVPDAVLMPNGLISCLLYTSPSPRDRG